MDVMGVTPHPFRMMARVPDDMVSLVADGEWAAWSGLVCAAEGDRSAVVLVSIAVTPFCPAPGVVPAEVIKATLRARDPEGEAVIEDFSTADGLPAVRVRSAVTQCVNGREVTTGQAQALVVYPGAGALGVVSGVCLNPADLDRAGVLVAGIAARMTVTAATAAA